MNALVAGMLFRRGLLLWLGTRCLASAVLALGRIHPLHIGPRAVVAMIAIATAASLAQTARLREHVLLANLGITLPMLGGCYAAGAAAGELVIAALGLVHA